MFHFLYVIAYLSGKLFRTFKWAYILLFKPIKSVQYYLSYLKIAESISVLKQENARKRYQLLNAVLLVKAIHVFYTVVKPNQTALDCALHFDMTYSIFPRSSFNIFSGMSFMLTLYCNYVLFIDLDFELMCRLATILQDNLNPKVKNVFLIVLNLFQNFGTFTSKPF